MNSIPRLDPKPNTVDVSPVPSGKSPTKWVLPERGAAGRGAEESRKPRLAEQNSPARDAEHALLSASSSHRWLNCTPAPRLEEQLPEAASEYAESGRLAHSIAELKARKYFLEPMSSRTYNARLKKLQEDPYYDRNMDGATDMYLDHLKKLAMDFKSPSFVALETRVDYSDYVPGGFGTADCIMIGEGRLDVIDYKNGAGVLVEAEGNSQMMLYALGALKIYAPIFGDTIKEVYLSIVQPNASGIKETGMDVEALKAWGEGYVKPRAEMAFSGEGDFFPGEWCRFCRARAQCSARAAKMLELEPMKGAIPDGDSHTAASTQAPVPLLTDAQVGDVLTRALDLEAWVKDLKDYALADALAGREISGFKVVEGRGSRDWKDLDSAFETLRGRGIDDALLWERKPVTPPALEKAIGKASFAEASEGLVEKKPGKPALVPASDKRPQYNAACIAFGEQN